MIDHLDKLLRKLFTTRIDEITSDAQVRFQPPDEDWRKRECQTLVKVGGGGQKFSRL